MKIVTKILGFFSVIGAFFSAIFFVLMKQAKTEKEAERLASEAETFEAMFKTEKAVSNKLAQTEAEDEELNKRVHSGNNLDNFNASLDMLRKQTERGNKRNSGSDNSGA